MRAAFLLSGFVFATAAQAQVTTNDAALQALQPAPAAHPAPAPAPAPAQAAKPRREPRQTAKPPAARPAPKAPAAPAVPAAPPANPVIAPPPPAQPHQAKAPETPVPVKPDAQGAATALPNGGTRITFGPGTADMSQSMQDAVRAIARQALADQALTISITAWAPGTAEDPSSPRRLSLDRALAARAILINAGVPSARIRAVAQGFAGIEGGPPDRLEIVAAAARSAPPGSPLPPPPTHPK